MLSSEDLLVGALVFNLRGMGLEDVVFLSGRVGSRRSVGRGGFFQTETNAPW